MTARVRLPSLLIERAVTDDLDGQPWPPTGLMDGWYLIRSADGRSLWRRLSLASRPLLQGGADISTDT